MIVKLIKDHTYNGVKFKKGQKIVMSKAEAAKICQDEIAVSNSDTPCGGEKKKKKKKKAAAKPTVKSGQLDIEKNL